MSQTIVIFGASGDLTARKLVPALYELFRKRRLPEGTRIAVGGEELRGYWLESEKSNPYLPALRLSTVSSTLPPAVRYENG